MRSLVPFLALAVSACGQSATAVNHDGGAAADFAPPGPDMSHGPSDLAGADLIGAPAFCDLPGSLKWTANGPVAVPGGPMGATDLKFLRLPTGFCSHFFARVGNARNLRFAPGGELMVASPTKGTTGGGPGGQSAIMMLPDDDQDGVADKSITFIGNIPATQGMAFSTDHFYYQDNTRIFRIPYKAGDRAPSAKPELIADFQASNIYTSGLHWPKPIDIADDGTVYVGNGGDQGEMCDPLHPFHGGIVKLDGNLGITQVAKGFRNPISLRCPSGHDRCFALELALDYSTAMGGREKLVPIRQGDDWGYPCCATKDLPYMGINPIPDCSGVQAESGSFLIGDTPFGVDFETGKWPAPWTGRAVVALHGAFGTWEGARVVAIGMDANSGLPMPNVDQNGKPTGAMTDFANGWDDKTLSHGRPASVEFAADGRMFLGNDVSGDIVWIAPF